MARASGLGSAAHLLLPEMCFSLTAFTLVRMWLESAFCKHSEWQEAFSNAGL